MGRKRAYAPLDVYMNRRKVGQYFRDPDGAFVSTQRNLHRLSR